MWTDDTALSTRISRRVAHYTGQAELAQAIQEGFSARKSGRRATATAKLQRAMELAVESGNDGTAKLLRGWSRSTSARAPPGCDATVAAADEMALDARSTKNRASAEGGLMPTCPEGHASTADDYCDVCGVTDRNR